MVTIQTADNALKSFYLDAVTEALDTKTNPLLAQIQCTTADVTGKDVRKLVKVGLNGGIGAGSETGDLPSASSSDYMQLVTTLKNLYGTIEISDKAIRASANNEGAFVNLLNDEMQSLIKSAKFNFSRMLFGDGTGKIATVVGVDDYAGVIFDNVNGLAEGMIIDFYYEDGSLNEEAGTVKILSVDRNTKKVITTSASLNDVIVPEGSYAVLCNSKDYEITGLEAIFKETGTLYGISKQHSLMKPYIKKNVGSITESVIQKAIDSIEERTGSQVNCILCSWGVRRALVEYFRANNVSVTTMDYNGATALNFNGIPVITDRFCPEGTMYLLNTEHFKLHQLCDWQWLEGEDGKILKQIPGKPVYTATLVKYAELLCECPCGQGKLMGITEA